MRNIGIEQVFGTLEDKSILAQCAQSSDAVINTANSDHRESIEIIIEALCGTGKTFIHTSSSSVVGDDALGEYEDDKIYSDDAPFTPISIRKERANINNFVQIAGVKDGIKTMVITPPMVYGDALSLPAESDQLPKLIYKSKKKGLNR